jgi:MFS family permease
MERINEDPHVSSIRQVAFASFIGTAVEWYDFFIYGTSAALVFPRLFFPEFSPQSAMLASLATFGVAFVARPLGGAVFGHFGDRIGRKSMLVITLLVMGGATFLIGVLPTYEQIGWPAPVLLVVLRFLQGFAVGGEWGGAMLMTVEHAPADRRNFYASWPQSGVPAGLILSTIVFAVFSALPDEQFFAWGWRVPFLLSIILIAVGLFIRLRILESPVFTRIKELRIDSKAPLIELLRDYPMTSTLAVGAVLVVIVPFQLITVFTLAHATGQLGIPRSVVIVGLLLAGLGNFAGIVVFARIADHVGTRRVAFWSAVTLLALSYPYFWLVETGVAVLIWLAMTVWVCASGALFGVCGVFLAELFPARVRYSGISFGFQTASMLGGALASTVATGLAQWAGGRLWLVATYAAINALINVVAIHLASRTRRVDIDDVRLADPVLARSR